MGIEKIQNELRAAAKKEKIKIYQNFHKTSNDGYAQGEIFLGVTVPDIRKVALSNLNISDEEIIKLLASIIHEEKYVAAEIISGKYSTTRDEKEKRKIFDFYISIAGKLTGWDLVDTTASQVVGRYIYTYSNDYSILNKLAHGNLWERRVAIIATWYLIKNKKY